MSNSMSDMINILDGMSDCFSLFFTAVFNIKLNVFSIFVLLHSLKLIAFLENLGQVSVEVTTASGGVVDAFASPTPNGMNICITNTGSYVVTFTLSNGDVYYGEFEVTD